MNTKVVMQALVDYQGLLDSIEVLAPMHASRKALEDALREIRIYDQDHLEEEESRE